MKSTMFVCTHSIVGINETSTNGETVTAHETKEARRRVRWGRMTVIIIMII